jgi:succinate-acetate transporter protein
MRHERHREPVRARLSEELSMSVESDVQAGAAAAPAPAAPAGNPALLGLATFLPGGITLGLWLVGYLPAGDLGGMIPALVASSGLFLLIAAVWAAWIGASAVSAILGTFSAFWLSLGFMVAAVTSGWFALTEESTPLPTFLLSWLIVFVALTLATLRLPLAFTAGFLFVDIAVALVLTFVLTGGAIYSMLAGISVFVFCAIFAYIWVDGLGQDLGGRALPMGSATIK